MASFIFGISGKNIVEFLQNCCLKTKSLTHKYSIVFAKLWKTKTKTKKHNTIFNPIKQEPHPKKENENIRFRNNGQMNEFPLRFVRE